MFYIEKDSKIVLFDENIIKLQNTIDFMPQYKDCEIQRVQNGYTIVDFQLVSLEEAEQIENQKQREEILGLKCTKRVFALCLKELGISYSQLKELIESNEDAQLEWDLCVELERRNPLLDIMALQLNVDSEMLDKIFMFANGMIDTILEEEQTEEIENI